MAKDSSAAPPSGLRTRPDSAHTPGPWEFGGRAFNESRIGPPPGHNKGFWIASAWGPDQDANARLIAAAPDMMAALEPFDDALGEDDDSYPDDMPVTIKWGATTVYSLTLGDLRRARAAIAKAEGRS